jgi:hypothetical protein
MLIISSLVLLEISLGSMKQCSSRCLAFECLSYYNIPISIDVIFHSITQKKLKLWRLHKIKDSIERWSASKIKAL